MAHQNVVHSWPKGSLVPWNRFRTLCGRHQDGKERSILAGENADTKWTCSLQQAPAMLVKPLKLIEQTLQRSRIPHG